MSYSGKKSDSDSVDIQDSSSYKKGKNKMFSSEKMMLPNNGTDNKTIILEDD